MRLLAFVILCTAAAQAQTVITLERGICYGKCPVYSVQLQDSGKVVWNGQKFVQTTGAQTATIGKQQVLALAAEIRKAGFFTFQDAYTKMDITDGITNVISVGINGKVKRVSVYSGDRSAPQAFRALAQRIDEVAGTKRWIGTGGNKPPGNIRR